MAEKIKVSCRLGADLVQFLDEQVEAKRSQGKRSDRSLEVAIAIRQRQISKLPAAQRKALYAKLKIAT